LIAAWPLKPINPDFLGRNRLSFVSDEMESDEHQKRIPVATLQQMLQSIGFTNFLHYTFG
jgi:hypothetical protein